MSKKILFHTIKIKVPEDMISVSKDGTLTIKKTLTKSKTLSKVKGKPAIDIIEDKNIIVPVIANKGELIDVDEMKEKKKATKRAKKIMTAAMPDIETNIITPKVARRNKMKKEVIPVFDALEKDDKKWNSVLNFEDKQEPVESNVIITKRARKKKSNFI